MPSPARTATFALWLAIALAVTLLYGATAMDDFFITYRYADNFASGNGFVFNPGERVFGLTEPVHGFVLALACALTRAPAPWLGTISTAVALLTLAWVLWREGATSGRTAESLVAGTLLVSMPIFWGNRGAGVLPGLALLAIAARARDRPRLTGALAALAAGFRPELALASILLFAGPLRGPDSRPQRLRFAAAAVVVAGAIGLSCWLYFGTPIPITLGAKRGFADWDPVARASGAHFWPGFAPLAERVWGATWWLFGLVALIGCWLVLRRGEAAGRLLVAIGLLLVPVYPLLGVPFFEWYALPTIAAACVGFARAAFFTGDLVARWSHDVGRQAPRSVRFAAVGLMLLLAVPPLRTLAWGIRNPQTSLHYLSYREAGEWIRGNSWPGASIAALEVGTLAYFSEREVVDLLGLVTPRALDRVRDRSVVETLRERPTDFFVLTSGLEGLIGPVRSLPWFAERYELARSSAAVDGGEMWIFRKQER